MKKLLFLSFLVSIAFACKTKQTAVAEESINNEKAQNSETRSRVSCSDLSLDIDRYNDTTLFRPAISDIQINENCVKVTYTYSGCGIQEPTLVWNKTINDEGTFPKVSLRLLMKNPGMCEAFFKDSISVDFSKLRTVGNKVLMIINDKEKDVPLIDFQN